MSMGPLYVLLGEVSVQILCPFFNWISCLPGVESCEFFIYFGAQTPVWGIIDKYVSPYSCFPFHFVGVFLSCAEDFSLMKSNLFTLSFVPLALGNTSENIAAWNVLNFPACFPLGFLWCHALCLSLLSILSFILVFGVSWWFTFIFLHVFVQISQHHLLKRWFALHFMFLPSLPDTNWLYWHGSVSGLSILFHWSMCLFLCQLYWHTS